MIHTQIENVTPQNLTSSFRQKYLEPSTDCVIHRKIFPTLVRRMILASLKMTFESVMKRRLKKLAERSALGNPSTTEKLNAILRHLKELSSFHPDSVIRMMS